jgi:hypothetical protein
VKPLVEKLAKALSNDTEVDGDAPHQNVSEGIFDDVEVDGKTPHS